MQASHQELALLRHELNRLYTSRTWGLLRSLYQTLAWLALPGHLIGRQLTLTPSNHVTVKDLPGRRAEWTFTGNDPQIELSWSKHWPLPPGHYELAIEVPEDAAWNRTMCLRVDTGHEYSESRSVALSFVRKSRDRYVAMFDLPGFTEALRLDPAGRKGRLVVGQAKIRLMTRPEFYVRAFSHIARDF
ncbi:MAG TPA: hypothetical protein VHB77_08075, partial [Planctomycetaceae bacterium]|nr:hypothetical protein [Planctomycetaceae bacterium]